MVRRHFTPDDEIGLGMFQDVRALAEVVNKDACANPGAFDWYAAYAARRAGVT